MSTETQHLPNTSTESMAAEDAYIFPMSFAEQRLWFLDQLQPGNPSYNIPWAFRIGGKLDCEALERALNEIVRRHEILRTTFAVLEERAVQIVAAALHVPVPIVDLSGHRDADSEARQIAREESLIGFDLKRGPLVRARVLRLKSEEHILLLTVHHIVFDNWSRRILIRELAALYEAYCCGRSSPLQELKLQYADYAVWQRENLQGTALDTQLAYWKHQLADAATLNLPTDHPRPAIQSYNGSQRVMLLPPELLAQLRALARQQSATLFMILLAAFDVLLARYDGQGDIAVGTPIANRNRAEIEDLIGFFANTLVLRTEVNPNLTFEELLARVKEVALGAYAHQDIPFEKIVEELRPERDLSQSPLFQVLFSVQNAPRQPWELPGLKMEPLDSGHRAAKFDLSLFCVEVPEGLRCTFEYNTDLFDSGTIDRIAQQFQMALADLTSNPKRRICEVSLLSTAEQKQVLVEFNDTLAEYRCDLCIHDFFQAQTERTPCATALVHENTRLNYAELNARANRVAHYLRKRGVGPETLVGICVERSIEMVVGILGILKAGGAYVPLDPAYPKERLGFILEDAKPSVVLTQKSLMDSLPHTSGEVIRLDADWGRIATESPENPASGVTPGNLAYVLFTSGSTGRPKGVALEHRSAANFIQWAQSVFTAQELAGTLFATSMCFDLSVFEMFVPLSVGGEVIMVQNALFLPATPAAKEVTLINTVPSAIAELLQVKGVPQSVLVVNLAGEPLPTSLARQIYAETRVRKVYNLYGPTETTTYSTFTLVGKESEVTIGRPIANTQVYILDSHNGVAPIQIPGELYIAGDGLARGYYGRQELTEERFVPNPFGSKPGARMYRTGDLARFLPNGNIQYLGRMDHQVKLRGFRIELGEIEAALAKCPGVSRAIVIVREGQSAGDRRLVAYVSPKAGETLNADQLRNLLKLQIPEFMVPSSFVMLDTIPVTANGKIDRRSLPAPESDPKDAGRIIAPRNQLEATLLAIFEKVLGIKGIGVTDNFFDLGGHSLLAVRLAAEVAKIAGVGIPLSAFFRASTVESLAEIVGGGTVEHPDPVATLIQSGDGRVPLFAVASPGAKALGYALLARNMGERQAAYKLQGAAPIVGNRPFTDEELVNLSREYIAAMRTVQPTGPYCFIAMCDGVQIAQKMVLDLEADGQEVGFFAILDTWAFQNAQIKWRWLLNYYRQRLRKLRLMPSPRRLFQLKKTVGTHLRIIGTLQQPELSKRWHQAYWPGKDFKPPRFQAPVVLFKRPKQPFYYIEDPKMGWGVRSAAGVEIHAIQFQHLEALREPYVGIIGRILAKRIQEFKGHGRATEFVNSTWDAPVRASAKV